MRPRDIALLGFCILMVVVGCGALVGGVYVMFKTGNPQPLPSVSPNPGEPWE